MTYENPDNYLSTVTKKTKGLVEPTKSGYTIGGEECGVADSVCLARKNISKTEYETYYIKVTDSGVLYDFMEDRDGYRKKDVKYKKINGTCFDYYMKFLKTKNNAWLLQARREQQNG